MFKFFNIGSDWMRCNVIWLVNDIHLLIKFYGCGADVELFVAYVFSYMCDCDE